METRTTFIRYFINDIDPKRTLVAVVLLPGAIGSEVNNTYPVKTA